MVFFFLLLYLSEVAAWIPSDGLCLLSDGHAAFAFPVRARDCVQPRAPTVPEETTILSAPVSRLLHS